MRESLGDSLSRPEPWAFWMARYDWSIIERQVIARIDMKG